MIEEISTAIDRENLLKGKTVVITGAGSGIGKEIARSFSNKGADLILLSKSTEKLNMIYDEIIANSSARVLIQAIDFESAEEKDYENLVKAAKEKFGKIDGLVNNAGILGQKKSLEQYDYRIWKNVLKVNLDAGFLLTKNFIPLLKQADKSSVIFTSSGVGRTGRAYWGAYSVSKFATEAMVQILSDELEKTSTIRVNCINPGAVRTKMREMAYPAENPERNPLPADIMGLYLYLMSDLSQKITGQSIDAQGS